MAILILLEGKEFRVIQLNSQRQNPILSHLGYLILSFLRSESKPQNAPINASNNLIVAKIFIQPFTRNNVDCFTTLIVFVNKEIYKAHNYTNAITKVP